jgi:hypothetical protein
MTNLHYLTKKEIMKYHENEKLYSHHSTFPILQFKIIAVQLIICARDQNICSTILVVLQSQSL